MAKQRKPRRRDRQAARKRKRGGSSLKAGVRVIRTALFKTIFVLHSRGLCPMVFGGLINTSL
jgi:hypothetical protein